MYIQNLVSFSLIILKMLNKTRIMTEWENDRTMDVTGQIFFQSGAEEGKQQWIEKMNVMESIQSCILKFLSLKFLKS